MTRDNGAFLVVCLITILIVLYFSCGSEGGIAVAPPTSSGSLQTIQDAYVARTTSWENMRQIGALKDEIQVLRKEVNALTIELRALKLSTGRR